MSLFDKLWRRRAWLQLKRAGRRLRDPSTPEVVIVLGAIVGALSLFGVFAPWPYGLQILISTAAVVMIASIQRAMKVTSRSVAVIAGERTTVADLLVSLDQLSPTLEERLGTAHDVWVSGPTLHGLIFGFEKQIEAALERGARFRFLSGSASDPQSEEFTKYFDPAYDYVPDQWEGLVRTSETQLRGWQRKFPGQVAAAIVPHFVAHNLLLTDPEIQEGTVQVHLNIAGCKTENAPAVLFYGAEAPELQRRFRDEFLLLERRSTSISIASPAALPPELEPREA